MPFTLANFRTFLKDNNWSDSSAKGVRQMDKIANDAALEMRRGGKFDFDRRMTHLSFAAVITDGTVAIPAGSTAITGTGTAFSSADVGKYIRFEGEAELYRIATAPTGTSATIERAYAGTSDLTAATYELMQPRVALPTNFRDFENPVLTFDGGQLYPKDLLEVQQMHAYAQEVSEPVCYAVENAEVSGVPTPYLWVYPAPVEKRVVVLTYYVWPAQAAADADAFGLPYEAEGVLREFGLALLLKEQKDPGWTVALQKAQALCLQLRGSSRQMNAGRPRQMWSSGAEGRGMMPLENRRVDNS